MNYKSKLTKEELEKHFCYETVDNVSNDIDSTEFKRRARYQQAIWRESNSLPIGSQPINVKNGIESRPLGSRIELKYAKENLSNFLSDSSKNAVLNRLKNPEPKQTLNKERLFADCLSSMPMCFNLFGLLYDDLNKASNVVKNWWPETPGNVNKIRFEWSPGRQLEGRFLENRSAFDVAFELKLNDSSKGLIGVETKYHEDCKKEPIPSQKRLERYKLVSNKSGVFKENTIDKIIGTELQQIWQDHLLALSLLQDNQTNWNWVKFILVYPEKNPSFKKAARLYSSYLQDHSTFESVTIESLINNATIDSEEIKKFKERYIWDDKCKNNNS